MDKTVAQLLREAAAALEEQRPGVPAPTPSSLPPTPDRLGERRTNRDEVVRMFRPYQPPQQHRNRVPQRKKSFTHRFICLVGRRQEVIPSPAERYELEKMGLGEKKITFPDKFCTATEFSDILLHNYPALRDCGGFQLLRSRGSSRSKFLQPIACPNDGYTPRYLCTSANIGQAILYARPLQRDIQIVNLTQTEEPGAHSQSMVDCVYCGLSFAMDLIQNHIDSCEIEHQPSCSSSSPASSSLSLSSPSTSASPSTPSTYSGAASARSMSPVLASRPPSFSSTSMSTDVSSEDWKREPDVKMAAQMFRTYKLKDADQKPTLVLTLDMHNTEEERERAIISFYKQTNVDWTRPFEVCLKGDCAIGDGVKKYFFSLCLRKIQTGLHLDLDNIGGKMLFFIGEADHLVPSTSLPVLNGDLFRVAGRIIGHSFLNKGPLLHGMSQCLFPLLVNKEQEDAVLQIIDCPDTDVTDIVCLLESQTVLTVDQIEQVNTLALSWDLPTYTEDNRRLLSAHILHHGVIVRREANGSV